MTTKLREIRLRAAEMAKATAPDPKARFPALVEVAPGGASRLRRANLAVIGAGSIGNPIVSHVARLSPRKLIIVDRSRFKPESVLTDSACSGPSLFGRAKAVTVARRAKKVSPGSRVLACAGPFEELSESELFAEPLDALFLSGDNLALEISVAQACLRFGVPVIHAAVHGETLTAQVRVYSMSDASRGPCPACGLSEKGEWDQVGRDAAFSCAPEKRAVRVPHPDRPPTASLSFLCSIAADLAVSLWVRRVLGIGAEPPDFCLKWSGYRLRSVVTALERNPECRCDHTRLTPARVSGPLPSASALDIAGAGGVGLEGGTFNLPGYRFVRIGVCACSPERPVGRFLRIGAALPRCRGCGEPIRPHPFFTTEAVPGEWLEAHRDVPLRALGAPGAHAAVVRQDGHAAFVTGGDDE